ncbi:unnamed protein product [Staurois parvus]|uniref:Uncharacterized protein n=1 Tax=Staurois parvus TaxID=386267 RepID=A0ABN9GRQ9_9NEOB|nr:unnamed protein product [Staurois parvus]
MTLGRKGLTSGAIKGLTVCCVCFYYVCCVFYLGDMLLCISLLCREIQSSMSILTGERSVFTHRSLPSQPC